MAHVLFLWRCTATSPCPHATTPRTVVPLCRCGRMSAAVWRPANWANVPVSGFCEQARKHVPHSVSFDGTKLVIVSILCTTLACHASARRRPRRRVQRLDRLPHSATLAVTKQGFVRCMLAATLLLHASTLALFAYSLSRAHLSRRGLATIPQTGWRRLTRICLFEPCSTRGRLCASCVPVVPCSCLYSVRTYIAHL